jgi:hypothetical protein
MLKQQVYIKRHSVEVYLEAAITKAKPAVLDRLIANKKQAPDEN